MYATCLFCHGQLGRNDVVRTFPVGRALAFDAAKGRLWVICPRCGRWNLTPLEERWEAVATCERLFRAAPLRAATAHIGLAHAPDGTRLVRVGAAPPAELAIWRYEREFRRRRRAYQHLDVNGLVLLLGMFVGGLLAEHVLPHALGRDAFRVGGLVVGGVWLAVNWRRDSAQAAWQAQMPVALVPGTGGQHLLRAGRVVSTELLTRPAAPGGWVVRVTYDALTYDALGGDARGDAPTASAGGPPSPSPRRRPSRRRWRSRDLRSVELAGEAATRAVRALLPVFNAHGGTEAEVARAVARLARAHDGATLLAALAAESESRPTWARGLGQLPRADRLALEMALTEDAEQRAMNGELAALEQAWREAEEIAAIADDLVLPADVRARWEALRR